MPTVQIGRFSITYNVEVVNSVINSSITNEKTFVFLTLNPVVYGGESLSMEDHYKIKVTGKIIADADDNAGSATQELTIGFVHNLVYCDRHVVYKNGTGSLMFTHKHESYPMLDHHPNQEWCRDLTAVEPERVWHKSVPNRRVDYDFSVVMKDQPRFRFPSTLGDKKISEVICNNVFVTCLVVRLDYTRYWIHSFNWKFKPDVFVSGELIFPVGGLDVGVNQPIHEPYLKPSGVKSDGALANYSFEEKVTTESGATIMNYT